MTSKESVNSMTDEQIADSLELTLKCLTVYSGANEFPEDQKALLDGAAIIRQRSIQDVDVSTPIQRIGRLADQLKSLPAWHKRALVYRRAASIMEQLPA